MDRLLISLLLSVAALSLDAKEIAITFDDAPRPSSYLGSKERTRLLINNLKKVKSPPVMFFATGKNLTGKNKANLLAYAKAGHFIAHHSDQHLWYHRTSIEDYKDDFLIAHAKFKDLANYQYFYRYPYLDQGRSQEKVEAMNNLLQKNGYQHGYVTVDNYDWYLDSLYQESRKSKSRVRMRALKKLYIKTLVEAAEFYDVAAQKYLKRSPKHVLLLHDNDLAAYFIDDLIIAFRKAGWRIISPIEAYQDPIAETLPKTLATSQGRVAALARDEGAKPREFSHNAIEEDYLKQQYETLVSEAKDCSLEALSFLEGQWEYRSKKNIFSEHWTRTSQKYKANGKVISLMSGKVLDQETITLSKQKNNIIYSALPSTNDTETDFKLVSCHKNRFAFINRTHDFPQLIVYNYNPGETVNKDLLTVEVKDLKGKGFTLKYKRLHNR